MEAISEETSIAMGIMRDKLYSTTRDRKEARGRGIVGYLARKVSGYGVKEIADRFGRSPVTMSEEMKKVEDLERRDKSSAKTLSLIAKNVVKRRRRKYRITEA
jgi:chromosomal replication initiation ATPase DnaA